VLKHNDSSMKRQPEWLCSPEDEELFSQFPRGWYLNNMGYVIRRRQLHEMPGSQCIRFHHVVIERMGLTRGSFEVDHTNRNRCDNRRENLRLATRSENHANRHMYSFNKTGYRGVSFYKEKGIFRARIKVNRKEIHLGYFPTAEDAAIAYNAASLHYFGEFGYLNILPTNLDLIPENPPLVVRSYSRTSTYTL
jgi:hypothetical protein